MARQQRRPIAPPTKSDQDNNLQDYTAVIQDNLTDLFEDSHRHDIRTTIPADNEGNISDIVLVFTGGSYYLYAKVAASTWKRTAALV